MQSVIVIIETSIQYTGLAVILFGFGHALFNVGHLIIIHHHKQRKHRLKNIRSEFGGYILLGLDFIIAADIIGTLMDKELSHLLQLVVAVAVRIAISYFLEKEIEVMEEK
jgi:uncharacterized membrane protein